jgi:hypothetical protein
MPIVIIPNVMSNFLSVIMPSVAYMRVALLSVIMPIVILSQVMSNLLIVIMPSVA